MKYFLLSIYACGLFACRQAGDVMFTSLPAASTGINFENKLHESERFNILYYLYYYNGAGVATGDINNDGLPDIFFTANHKAGNKLYLNKGNLKFEDITEKAGVAGVSDWCTGVTMADVNGDGLLDIYTCAVGNQFGLSGKNELYINRGDGKFSPEAAAYGLDFSGLSTQAAFFDYDHDGDLDMYLLNHSKKPHSNIIHASNRKGYDPVAGDRLYRQDRINGVIRFTDVSKEAGIYQSNLGYGLGIAIADFNNDGWEDIYIGNDFHENDYYYLNQGDGTFKEAGEQYFGHYSRFSMGNDAADYNNDGHIDVVTVDMLPPDEKTLKTYGSDENPNNYLVKLGLNGYQHQYSRNCLQQNNGNGRSFTETALMSGVWATDWSWAPLFADFDNDGNKDLFISSGIVKRPVDMDYVQFVSAQQMMKGLESTDKYDAETIEKMPDGASHPFFFKGTGSSKFEPVSDSWGTGGMRGYFNGAAYADLDKDGDLDMVINCINAPAVVLKNNAPPANYLRITALGDSANSFGIGLQAYVYSGGKMQMQQLMPTRGFQSASEPVLHFGMGTLTKADSVVIVWPGGQYQTLMGVACNKLLSVNQADAGGSFIHADRLPALVPEWRDVANDAGINWIHKENDFSDFNRQYLVPHKQSTRGPGLAVADVNGDGLDDFYVCGPLGQPGMLMLQQAGGTFREGNGTSFAANASSEEVSALFFDADGDGDQDLYVASGGYQFDDGQPLLADHLYLNDGKGNFEEQKDALPTMLVNKGCIAAADIDADGDIDLFVGALAHAGRFGTYQPSYLLRNNGKGSFEIANDLLPKAIDAAGMVTSAVFADVNGDMRPDLITAGEWMPVTIYLNKPGAWQEITIPNSSGWWQRLIAADINGDGIIDLAAGNWGLNNKLVAGKTGPVKMFIKDFDKNGREEQILAYTLGGKEYTFLAKDELERALPVLKKAYLTYSEVAGETVQYMFYDLFKDYREWKADTLASMFFINNGKGQFSMQPMPAALQVSPLFALSISLDGKSLAAGGNFYGVVPYEGRYDGMLLSSYTIGKQAFMQRPAVEYPALSGEIRDVRWLMVQDEPMLLVARSGGTLMLLKQPKNN
jgi:enediyne biosynthesis protein E4